MTIATAYWCILIVALMPYVWTVIAKRTGTTGRFNNRDPRAWIAKQDEPRVRWANGAQLNAFEGNPVFYAGVLMAQLAGVAGERIALLAVVYAVMRFLHGIFYITGLHWLRSVVWFIGLASSLALIVQAAQHIV